jgi:hypothetical protein
MLYFLALEIGAIVGCFVFARGFRWIIRKVRGPGSWILASHTLAFITIVVIVGFNPIDGKAPNFMSSFLTYIIPQLLLVVVDLIQERRNVAAAQEG